MTSTNSSKLVVSAPSDLEIVMTRAFDAPRQLVFDAWTKPEQIKRWLGRVGDTMVICEVDLRIGGAYRYVWHLHEGSEMGIYGEYREIVSPDRLVATEMFDEPYFAAMGSGTLNTITFEELDSRTVMTITVLYKSREARDAVLQSPMEEGAGESFDRLAELVAKLT
jgi:uncharacterized protein YndB with AHSA1/START domain